jgi:hypothetical protein
MGEVQRGEGGVTKRILLPIALILYTLTMLYGYAMAVSYFHLAGGLG